MGSPHFGLARYLVGGKYVGTRQVYHAPCSTGSDSRSGFWPHTAFICPVCGELWAREIQEHGAEYHPWVADNWRAELRACVQHGDGTLIPPTFPLEFVSPELLAHDAFILLLKAST